MDSERDIIHYNKKRNTEASGEPEGRKVNSKTDKLRFSIQKHDAQNLHYDLRLEFDGVLKSWAIPKGPSTDPSVKRLAIAVEDHPVDYLKFEGTIPEGNYGAGTVMLWDIGTYKVTTEKDNNVINLSEGIENGHFSIELSGKKLEGGYSFTRIDKDKGHWLLVKQDDEHADARRKPTKTETSSVKSDKEIEEIW